MGAWRCEDSDECAEGTCCERAENVRRIDANPRKNGDTANAQNRNNAKSSNNHAYDRNIQGYSLRVGF